jgi:uncharacterized protein YggU (UPF0235/DUF167 family)
MLIKVKVTPLAKKQKVLLSLQEDQFFLKVSTHKAPEKGKANRAIIEILALFFNLSPSTLKIVKGHTHSLKILDIPLVFEKLKSYVNDTELSLL